VQMSSTAWSPRPPVYVPPLCQRPSFTPIFDGYCPCVIRNWMPERVAWVELCADASHGQGVGVEGLVLSRKQADRQKVSGGPVDCCDHVKSEAVGKVQRVGSIGACGHRHAKHISSISLCRVTSDLPLLSVILRIASVGRIFVDIPVLVVASKTLNCEHEIKFEWNRRF
jgi:hypothetical protein